jgi:hypothetical protein
MMGNSLIQSLWIGTELSKVEILCIKSFLAHKHTFVLYTYNKITNIPDGAIVKDANEIMPLQPDFKTKDGSIAPFSDVFRLQMLYNIGGWWVDLDVVCIKSFDSLPINCIATGFERSDGDCAIPNVMCFEKGHPFLNYCLELWSKQSIENLYQGLGPDIAKQAVKDLNLQSLLVPHQVFNPTSYYHTKYLFDVNYHLWPLYNLYKIYKRDFLIEKATKDTHTIHLWNEMIRRTGRSKNQDFHKYSLFEKLKRKYGV